MFGREESPYLVTAFVNTSHAPTTTYAPTASLTPKGSRKRTRVRVKKSLVKKSLEGMLQPCIKHFKKSATAAFDFLQLGFIFAIFVSLYHREG